MLDEIEAKLKTDTAFRTALLSLLARHGLFPDARARVMKRAHAAAVMLDGGQPRAEAQACLIDRYDISRSTAYRDLARALNARQQLPLF